MEVLRRLWFSETIRECQVFVGHALPGRQRPLRSVFSEFLERIPDTQLAAERLMLRGLLLDLCLRWADEDHRSYHDRNESARMKCRFSPGDVAIEAWRDGARHPRAAFAHWADLYIRAFERAHPLHYAAEFRRRLDADFGRPLFLNRIAAELHVPIRRLQRDFKALTGMGVHEYVTKRRVTAAYELLTNTEDKVDAIAHAVGWSSRKNLNRALARHAGLTPAVIRQRHARAS